MDYSFTEEQEMLRNSFKSFFKKESPISLVRDVMMNRHDYSPALYRKMAELGFTGIMVPEQYGGMGGGWVDMAIFYEEAGRALVQSPHFNTVVEGAQLILGLGSEEQKKALLPGIASGGTTLALALKEPGFDADFAKLSTAAVKEGAGYRLTGNKLFVSNAHLASYLVVVGRMGQDFGLFLVDGKAPGISLTRMQSMTGEALYEVKFVRTPVPSGMAVPVRDSQEIESVLQKARVMTCAGMVGMAQVALEMAVDYSKQRAQFDHPIGSYQALQHKMARMLMKIEGARWITYYTAWKLDQDLPAGADIAMTELYVGQACHWVHAESQQVHGAVGVFRDHDLSLYFTRVKADQVALGQQYAFLETVAQSLGL